MTPEEKIQQQLLDENDRRILAKPCGEWTPADRARINSEILRTLREMGN